MKYGFKYSMLEYARIAKTLSEVPEVESICIVEREKYVSMYTFVFPYEGDIWNAVHLKELELEEKKLPFDLDFHIRFGKESSCLDDDLNFGTCIYRRKQSG